MTQSQAPTQFQPNTAPAYRVELDPAWDDQRWVQIPKQISRDRNLSTEAVGAVVRLVDNQEQFRFTQSFLAKKFGWGRQKTADVLKELRLAGYLESRRDRDEKGRMVGETVYVLHPFRRFEPVSAGHIQDTGYRRSGPEQGKRDVSAGENVSAGHIQDTGYRVAGSEQGKRDVFAGHIQDTGYRVAGSEQGKRDVFAGHIQDTGYEQQTEPKEPTLKKKNPPPPPSSSNSERVSAKEEEEEEISKKEKGEPTTTDECAVAASLLGLSTAGWQQLGRRVRGELHAAVQRLLDEGADPGRIIHIVRKAGPLDGPDVKSPSAVLLYRLRDLDGAALVAPPKPDEKPSESKSEGAKAKSCERADCQDGRIVCSVDEDVCARNCAAQHAPRGNACPECTDQVVSGDVEQKLRQMVPDSR